MNERKRPNKYSKFCLLGVSVVTTWLILQCRLGRESSRGRAELIAYHEAGHALIALLLGGQVKQVTIEPDNGEGPDRQGDTQAAYRCRTDWLWSGLS